MPIPRQKGGQASCYALGYPLAGTQEFGASNAAGE